MIALLPMKGHSERVPNKNLKDFAGKPLFLSILSTLAESGKISKVVINTDSEQIADVAKSTYGEKVHILFRPESLCGDTVPMNSIIQYDLSQMPEEEYFLQTHATNPLLTVKTVEKAIDSFFEKIDEQDSLFSVTKLQTRLYWHNGRPINHNPEELLRTQDLPPVFEENSCIYIFSRASFLSASSRRIGLKPQMFELPKLEAVDIDEPEDFKLAENLYKEMVK
jgi:CMP-N-acetylneuraminic acid synthetase